MPQILLIGTLGVQKPFRRLSQKTSLFFSQATSGRGGWPMSVWLTPDLKPFYGGTYFPPDNRYYGQPGLKTLLHTITEQWKAKREKLAEQSSAILDALAKATSLGETGKIPGQEVISKGYKAIEKTFDEQMGGFGKAPKFPQPTMLSFLLRVYAGHSMAVLGERALEMTLFTLKMMAKGGMHDHVGQGFHRYSTDDFWHVPHFEKMLYDQAQLAVVYSEAFQITKDPMFADITKDILLYVSRDLSDPSGGFYSAEDADSHVKHGDVEKREGAFNVWAGKEVNSLLSHQVDGKEGITWAQVFSKHFDVREDGNIAPFQDPHDELKNKNVLIVRGGLEETAEHFKLPVDVTSDILSKSLKILFDEREKRPRPHLDNKMVTAWNGLMISGFAKAGQVLDNPEYLSRAVQAADFLYQHAFVKDKGRLLRTCYTGEQSTITQIAQPIEGFVDDYSFLIRGLLDLYEACYDERWLQWAAQLQEQQDGLFWDNEAGGYFASQIEDTNILLRIKDDQDGAEPSSNSVTASNLLRLATYLDIQQWRDKVAQIFKVFSDRLTKIPMALPELLSSLMMFNQTPKQIIVVGDVADDSTQALLRAVHSVFLPNKILIVWDGNESSFLAGHLKVLSTLKKKDEKATAFVCENYTCSLPVTTSEDLLTLLNTQPPPAGQ
ncbi:spermatogenesis-associated protein 20-like isoform X2 [Liolophura sinensis]|uniref:spermatogenesis-associated protein 20-like isoform X2 n=1 Tax=Liolophura sinensis TaxID=3198878 RepID=UPI003158578D